MQELIFGLIGGTALLMFGVDKMGEGLEKASGEMMKKILSVLTGHIWMAFLVGTFLTALVQSSTAITVLTVGFVNAGLMTLSQALGIIYGANIGTTITAQLMALSFHFKLTEIALPVLGLGFAINTLSRNDKLKHIGEALLGFGMMFLGLKILNSGIPYIRESETLRFFFQNYASIMLVGIVLGAAATALVHSSSATVGLVMILGQAGLVDLRTAILIMLGDNIGTCITAQMASLAGNLNARRAAWAHTLYNVIGVVIVALFLPYFVKLIGATTSYLQPGAGISSQVANSHTMFNLLSALVFLPLTRYYIKFLEMVVRRRDQGVGEETTRLDRLLLERPVAAFRAALQEIIRSAQIGRGMVAGVMESFFNYNDKRLEQIMTDEEIINQVQRQLTAYIVDISKRPLTESQSRMIPAMINSINNIERIGDHVVSLVDLAKVKRERKLTFSQAANDELRDLQEVVLEMFDHTDRFLATRAPDSADRVRELELRVDALSKRLSDGHIARLEEGSCVVESGVVFLDIVNYLERIADHIFKVCLEAEEKMQAMPSADYTRPPIKAWPAGEWNQ